jgi:hemolysin III
MVIALPVVVQALTLTELALLFAGGLLYTVGAVLFGLQRPRLRPHSFGFHELWHVMTVAAAGCHYALVLMLVRA